MLDKSVEDLKKLLNSREQIEAVLQIKRKDEHEKHEKIREVASALHTFARSGDLLGIAAIYRDCCAQIGSKVTRSLLIEHRDPKNNGNTALLEACLNGHLDLVQFLVRDCGASTVVKDGHELGSTPVHLAAAYGHLKIVAFLCDFNRDMVELKNNFGDTALNRAAIHGRIKVVEYLVDHKRANIENRGELGRTPLLGASVWGRAKTVEFLLKRGANFFAKDSETESMAPHLAAYFGHANCIQIFLDHYPDVFSFRNKNGYTPLARARQQKKLNVVNLLEARGAKE